MLVIDARLWPGGDAAETAALGRIAIGRVGTSAGGDFADYLVVNLDANDQVMDARMLRRRSVTAGWRDLLWAGLDGEGAEPVAVDDPRVAKVVAKLAGSGG